MRRTAGVIVVVAVVLLGAQRLRTATPRLTRREPPASVPTAAAPTGRHPPSAAAPGGQASPPLPATPGGTEVAVAERWVAAMWTRLPGDPPFRWLDRVADITAAGLAAQLRTARATLADAQVLSESVEVVGAYPDALDPTTVTVTCVAHLITRAGRVEQPCATTVTVTPGAAGRLVVSGLA